MTEHDPPHSDVAPENHRITRESLGQHVPIYQDGLAAKAELTNPDGKITARQRKKLEERVAAGERSRDLLLSEAMPLMQKLAHAEYRRRVPWGTAVEFDDLLQEACYGFIRGLAVFDIHKVHASPSMYLAQWASATMRRSADRTESDLATPSDVNQRWRVIRAVRTRLRKELGREPTDHEIVEASLEIPQRGKNSTKLGRVGQEKAPRVTLEEIADERKHSQSSASALRIIHDTDEYEAITPGTVRAGSIKHHDSHNDAPAGLGMGDVLVTAMVAAELGEQQIGIISQFHGLPPYDTPAPSVTAVATAHGVTQIDTQKVLDAYTTLMAAPGGPLHQVVLTLSPDHLETTGLDWVIRTLGTELPATTPDTPKILYVKLSRRRVPATPTGEPGSWMAYQCLTHGRTFIIRVPPSDPAPPDWPCPTCQERSPQVALEER